MPVFTSPAPTTNIAPMVTVAGLPNPESPSSGVTSPKTISNPRTHIATRSTLNLFEINRPKATSRITTVSIRFRLSKLEKSALHGEVTNYFLFFCPGLTISTGMSEFRMISSVTLPSIALLSQPLPRVFITIKSTFSFRLHVLMDSAGSPTMTE